MTERSVAETVPAARTLEGAGMLVHRTFPSARFEQIDPFLLLDEMGPSEFAPRSAPGFPDHPHRGFETVTYMLEGVMDHRDSVGNKGSIGPGDVQWMTAGAGVVHSEMPGGAIDRNGRRLHGFQLWVNLPAADKMVPPRYQGLDEAGIPVVDDGTARIRVVSGSHAGTTGPIETHTPILYLHATLQPGATLRQEVPASQTGLAYVFSGGAAVGPDKSEVQAHSLAVFAGDGDELVVTATGDVPAEVLLMAGEPLREPLARYGPFVMNTRQQIVEAVEDYQAGRMGAIA